MERRDLFVMGENLPMRHKFTELIIGMNIHHAQELIEFSPRHAAEDVAVRQHRGAEFCARPDVDIAPGAGESADDWGQDDLQRATSATSGIGGPLHEGMSRQIASVSRTSAAGRDVG
jgi:hypothetical protein